MTYIQLTSGNGGWPMSVFLTPDLTPFFGATYFPPDDHFGKPGFKTLLNRIAQLWRSNSDKVKASGDNMMQQLKSYLHVNHAQMTYYQSTHYLVSYRQNHQIQPVHWIQMLFLQRLIIISKTLLMQLTEDLDQHRNSQHQFNFNS